MCIQGGKGQDGVGKVGKVNYGFEGGSTPGCSFNPVGFLELPIFLVLSVVLRDHFRWGLMLPMFAVYLWKECVPMSVCLHRYFSHKGFRCGRSAQFALYCLGCLASQGPPLWWASKHRRHHAHCDTENDPHSPVVFGKLYAWLGWAYLGTTAAEGPFGKGHDQEFMRDHMRFPELALMENFYWAPIALSHALSYAYGGIGWCVYVSMMSGVLCQVLTLYFNVVFHSPPEGSDTKGTCKALDLPYDPLSNVFGEAFHAWHHRHPMAHKRPGIDLPYWFFIKPLLAAGIFTGENKLAAANVK